MGRGDPGRARHPQPAGVRAVQRRRDLAGPVGRDRRGDPRLGRARRRDRAAPVVHGQDGRRRRCRCSTRSRCGCTASRGSASSTPRLAVRHQRQHLRAGDDGRREGRRPDRSATPRCRRRRALLPPPRGHARSTRPGDPPQPARRTTMTTDDDRSPRDPIEHRSAGASTSTGSGRSSAPGPTRSSARRTPTCRARSCRRRPAACWPSRTSRSTSRPGEVFVVMGLSGSGKSTLVRLLTRLIEPTAGTVQLDGEDITAMSDEAAARDPARASVVDGLPALRSAAAPPGHRQRRVRARGPRRGQGRPAQPGPGDGRPRRPVGYENSYPDQLSGGMQQRVGLARALAADPTCCCSTSRSRRSTR